MLKSGRGAEQCLELWYEQIWMRNMEWLRGGGEARGTVLVKVQAQDAAAQRRWAIIGQAAVEI